MKSFISPSAIAALCGVLPAGTYKGNRKKTSETIRKKPGKTSTVDRFCTTRLDILVPKDSPSTPGLPERMA